ncbi:hypothetical protein ACFPA8_02560 [Streptomyces ovatisporus]|uniref:Uncharacterized protein n=1 Tax=Streptomyces ovatisporus TaxID=1128682 RepID=A0ABV9A1E7_9ACTN
MVFGTKREAVQSLDARVTGIESGIREDVTTRTQLLQAVGTAGSDLGLRIDDLRRAQDETTRELTDVRRDIAELLTLIERQRADTPECRADSPEPAQAGGAGPRGGAGGGGESDESSGGGQGGHSDDGHLDDHSDLLAQAAGLAEARLVCHRDTWAFVVERAAHGEHFRMPVDISHTRNGTVEVELSGRTLLAVVDALWEVTQTPGTAPATHHLAAQTYNRIHGALAPSCATAGGDVVRIVIDDRQPPDPDGPGGPGGPGGATG